MTSYRFPNEHLTLAITLIVLTAMMIVAAAATAFILPILLLLGLGVAFYYNWANHQELLKKGYAVNPSSAPLMAKMVQELVNKLRPSPVQVFIIADNHKNAYTFGVFNPKIVVMMNGLFKEMEDDELRFILGHELGHVALGHTWLNTLIGGIAGVPTTIWMALVISLAFRWWNRACEYSADRAGLLACGSLQKSISALVKLVASDVDTQAEFQQALREIDKEDDSILNVMAETLSTHPMLIRRIGKLRKYSASPQYRNHQMKVNSNLNNLG